MKKKQDTPTPADGTTVTGNMSQAGPYVPWNCDALGEISSNEENIDIKEMLPLESSGPESLQNKRQAIFL
jgi:hypothetical protein